MKNSKQLKELEDKHISEGTQVMIQAPEESKQSKWNGQKGIIKEFNCKWNPIPTVELHNGPSLAVELKHLVIPQQESLFKNTNKKQPQSGLF